MLVFYRWSIAGGLALLGCAGAVQLAHCGEPLATPAANCNWLPLPWCVKAPYTCKPEPCPPPCDYAKCCGPYCAKPMPCPPNVCQQWFTDRYCSKPPVCSFPGDPCPPCVPNKHGKK